MTTDPSTIDFQMRDIHDSKREERAENTKPIRALIGQRREKLPREGDPAQPGS